MNIEELKNKINDLQKKSTNWEYMGDCFNVFSEMLHVLNNLDSLKKDGDYKRWRAEEGECYFLVKENFVEEYEEGGCPIDDFNYNSGNYFKEFEKAQHHKRWLLIKQKIEDIALRLNEGRDIDWKDDCQKKYFIDLNCISFMFGSNWSTYCKREMTYCLSDNFLDEVLKEIGEDGLKFYFGVKE